MDFRLEPEPEIKTTIFVTNELDSGEVILQKSVVIDPSDNADTLAKKVLKQEHILYPEAIKTVMFHSLLVTLIKLSSPIVTCW
jgi:folate-dependent phosphoribosylglycinamide formyltransferase PurN